MPLKIKLKDIDLKDALDLAIEVELEAQERYIEFARQIGSVSKDDAGDFFAQMAINETKHANDLKAKRIELFGISDSRISLEDLYEFQEIEAPEFDKSRSFMSPKKALLVARDSEIKAYKFFDKAASLVSDQKVKELFLELRGEELQHQKMVEALLSKVSGDEGPLVDSDEIDEPNGL